MTGDVGDRMLQNLASAGPISMPVAIVVAHPDDEMIGAAGSLARMRELALIHVTDGAPIESVAWRAAGTDSREQYASIRRNELEAALNAACTRPVRQLCYACPDGQVASHVDAIRDRLAVDLMSVEAVITHPYEGGHVDHDACARAVHAAVRLLNELTGQAPAVLEFASYYRRYQELRAGLFWEDPGCPEVVLALSPSAARRRQAAFACFRSQSYNLRYFSLCTERFRRAPNYDFSRSAPPLTA